VAINLWKTGGRSTSFSPLTTGWNNGILNGLKVNSATSYTVRFRAKSPSGAILKFYKNNNDVAYANTLTTEFVKYEVSFTSTLYEDVWFYDQSNRGDIIIDSIELVQKPLPKLTINGVDGFLSGKWVLHANAQIVDDETLVLNATATGQFNSLTIPCTPNTNYILSFVSSKQAFVDQFDGINGTGTKTNLVSSHGGVGATNSIPFTTTATANSIVIALGSGDFGAGNYTFKRPMLNVGSSPVPYSRKTGDKMVLPTAKKNLFNKLTASADGFRVDAGTGTVLTSSGNSYSDWITIKPNTRYTASNLNILGDATGHHCAFYDVNKTYISGVVSSSLTSPSNAVYLRISFTTSLKDLVQLEEGSTATSYEPFNVQLNKKPNHAIAKERSGMAFNGVTDYLQLPSMTMDSIEIDCLIDSVQPNNDPVLVDARTGLVNGYATALLGIGSGWNTFKINGVDTAKSWSNIPKGTRTKVYLQATGSFTDDVGIFGGSGSRYGKGTLYKVTCYLNGQVIAQYDFENPSNVVGNTIIPKAQNLIPSFEDPRWSFNMNTQVLGKDLLRLNTVGNFQSTTMDIPVDVNSKYLFYATVLGGTISTGGYAQVIWKDISGNVLGSVTVRTGASITINTPPVNTKYATVMFSNSQSGAFDFIKPQLCALDGKEGTLNGTPVQLNKPSKRTLYAKR
jgi:hypothetical protein